MSISIIGGKTDAAETAALYDGLGAAYVSGPFEPGIYRFTVSTSPDQSVDVTFVNSSNVAIASSSFSTSAPFVLRLDSAADGLKIYLGASQEFNVALERFPSETKRVVMLRSSQTYTLPFTARAYVFGGGGSGGLGRQSQGGGGGGSGYLSSEVFPPGTYSAIVGASTGVNTGGYQSGNFSQFGTLVANGGAAGGGYTVGGASGGAGGSGGGAAPPQSSSDTRFGLGGQNGASGESIEGGGTGGQGSGVTTPIQVPISLANSLLGRGGTFYAGGNGGNGTNLQGQGGGLASGGGGGSGAGGTGNIYGGSGGAGVIFLVEV